MQAVLRPNMDDKVDENYFRFDEIVKEEELKDREIQGGQEKNKLIVETVGDSEAMEFIIQ